MQATYISSSSFSISGDHVLEFVEDRRIRTDCGVDGIEYCTILGSSYSDPNTTVVTKESELTSNLTAVLYGIVEPGVYGSLPDHSHDGSEGSGDGTAAGSAMIFAADAAAQIALLSGEAGAAFSFNSQNLTSVGTIGCGNITATAATAISNIKWTDTASYGAWRFYENAVLRAGLVVIGSTFATEARRNDVEISSLSGDITFWLGANLRFRTDVNGDVDITAHDAATVGLKLGGTLVTASAAEINALDGISANGTSFIQAANYAAMMALLSGEAGAAFSFNSQNLTSVGTIGCTAVSITGARPMTLSGGSTAITKKGVAGSWAFGFHAVGSGDTDRGGFGFLGNADALTKYYIGTAYDDAAVEITAAGNLDITKHNASTIGLKLGGTHVTASAAEINQLDGNAFTAAATAADHGAAATDEIINVCYGTGDPPTANTTTIGTLFIKYVA